MVKIRNWLCHNETQMIDEEEKNVLTCLAHKSIYGLAQIVKQLDVGEAFDTDFQIIVNAINDLIGNKDTCKVKYCGMSDEDIIRKLPEFPVSLRPY